MPVKTIGRAGFIERSVADEGPPELEHVFAAGGLLAQQFPDYAPRDAQIQMARQVHKALGDKRHLLVESPCGVGKSVAYLVPAVLHRARTRHLDGDDPVPIIVVTGTIALQEQLVQKDLPLLQRILPQAFTFGLLKGRQNYACHAQVDFNEGVGFGDLSRPQLNEVEAIRTWFADTPVGDRSELDFDPSPEIWRRFSMNPEDCAGRHCAFVGDCFAFRAQAKALSSDIIVTNYHTVFTDVLLRRENGIGFLPPESPLILDEAHEAADIARTVLGGRLTFGRVLATLKALERANVHLAVSDANAAALDGFKAVTAHSRSPAYRARLQVAGMFDPVLEQTLARGIARIGELLESEAPPRGEQAARLQIALRRAGSVRRLLSIINKLPEDYAVAVSGDPKRELEDIDIYHIDVGPVLRDALFERPTVVATSATLAADGSFGFLTEELGAPPETTDMEILPSPFDFQSQALLVVPPMPDNPNTDEWRESMVDTLVAVIKAAEGRTLALFTSYRNLNLAAEGMRGCPYRVLRQGDAPKMKLIGAFKSDVSSVLLGTTSFWTGVDVPGSALSCVFIDKLPFPEPTNPVLNALESRTDNVFGRYSLPRAVIALRQGAGRLIRTVTDRGVVVVCDPRIRTKPYGRAFLRSLPNMRQSPNITDIHSFLGADDVGR